MESIETIFKHYGKRKIVKYIRDYFTDRINENMTIDFIRYTLDNYELTEQIEKHLNTFKNSPDFWNI